MEPAPFPESPVERREDIKQLRMLTHAAAISLLILTGTLFIFFYRQVVALRKNTRELVNYIVEYDNSNAAETIKEVHRQYADFAREHPDFLPFYKRYFGTNEPPPRLPDATNAPGKVVPAPPR